MNYKILLSVFIAFSIVFGSLFFIFFNPITVESNTNPYPAFSLTLDKKSQNLFLLGSSHIGHLNSSLIVNSIHESYPSTSILISQQMEILLIEEFLIFHTLQI